MQCIHGLLSHAYCAFLVACGHKGARSWAYAQPHRLGGGMPGAPAIGDVAHDGAGHGDVDSDGDHEDVQPEPEERGGDLPIAVDAPDWAALNAKARRVGFDFIRSMPLGTLMALRRCLEPFRVLIAKMLKISGDDWEQKQRLAASKADDASAGARPKRQYRVLIAATHVLEDEFHASTKTLLQDSTLWQFLPDDVLVQRFQCLLFRMLSRMMCAVHELLRQPHARYPFRLFLVLEDRDVGDVVAEDARGRPCSFDSFAKGFVEQFGADNIGGDDASVCLEAIAAQLQTSIAHIESRRAALRRFLKATPLATKKNDVRQNIERGVGVHPLC